MSTLAPAPVNGVVSAGFEAVRQTFADNFHERNEAGGACAVSVDGQTVVDLWGGVRNIATQEPWERDTMVIIYSATKGLAAMALAVAHSRGWLDYEAPVAAYWPEFAQCGKERITVRQLLAHQAGLHAFDEPVDRAVVADPDRLAAVMARQTPAWPAGSRQAYHAITLGFYESELMRRVDPARRTIGRFFQDEIATPLGIEAYIRIPSTIPDERFATITPPSTVDMLTEFPLRVMLAGLNHRSHIYRALVVNPGFAVALDDKRIYSRELEVPSGGGVATARALAAAYGALASGDRRLGLKKETLDLLAAPPVPPLHGFHDECLKGDVRFSLGFMKPGGVWHFGGPRSFGSPGSGGSLGFADPDAGVGYGYVTCQMGARLTGDPRDEALRNALYASMATS